MEVVSENVLLADKIAQLIAATKGDHATWESTADPDDADMIVESSGWQIMRKDNTTVAAVAEQELEIVEMDTDKTWYNDYFFGKPHVTFVGKDKAMGALVISVVKEDFGDDFHFRVRVLSQAGRQHVLVSSDDVNVKNKDLNSKMARKVVNVALPALEKMALKVADDEKFCKRLATHETSELVTKYKFGLLYVKDGQTVEEDMFANDGYVIDHSPEYQEFCDWLGDTIELQGWEAYRAGLDVRSGGTGTTSIYTQWRHFEVMWHVATMLPYFPTDVQQLQRKRHLGNDIVMVVFVEGSTPYVPTCVYSQFNHVLLIVQPVDKELTGGRTCYRMSMACKSDVGTFGPKLPRQKYFERSQDLRNWLYARLINGERTAILNAAGFRMTRERTAQLWLADVCNDFGIS
ncbi:GTPase activating protein Rap1-GAP [Thecamonas trahens ATCC 50062]|uniref:GTPase activating protein Rap1-GAP n=1 Tax=Thecamonas trahens ATCC 50062 TaxID=461836 RepID=A0A0L0DGL6_THETB|nr:GTPase activating protein Rap1-GAP [Thecamonas trahens ATCC 50062]KNC51479.1 GTPase activating protein Rap1-GAP [Thecamonas trahens ATCC 50062]|eukprot:XP_013756140.1 GTPase activating protein Rap1-GAP [Thecamonas trahens ATCC 50062]